MPQYYRLANPSVSSFHFEGIEHHVNGDGVLEIHEETPGLTRELDRRGAVLAMDDPAAAQQATADLRLEEDFERQELFGWLDARHGRHIDRRRSLKQLRDMKLAIEQKDAQRAAAGIEEPHKEQAGEEPPADGAPGPAKEA